MKVFLLKMKYNIPHNDTIEMMYIEYNIFFYLNR